MRYIPKVNARISRSLQLAEGRRLLFGHSQGLPGERWWARPLVARDMMNWYFPSKYGFPEFQLEQYYEMQAERFRKREGSSEWVAKLGDVVKMVREDTEGVRKLLDAELVDSSEEDVRRDLRAVLRLVDEEKAEGVVVGEGGRASILSLLEEGGKSRRAITVAKLPVSEFSKKSVPKVRHRFIDPLFRRRRLKWMERFLAGMNNAKEIRLNRHFTRHPDSLDVFPSNLGSVTVKWPNRRN